ncbi:forkhead box protein N3-like isoform X6 [Balaenoptera acutorostrata]|uniref:Forkhead box protein N3 n=1 Tax=Balaenoptera acutorostrata TaxID=9767 RepID=A0ABM3T7T1_BALAC|nr:forkhead box protein N3-like isoform X6 [Balaenoptera acutorostrata]
MGPVMPPSKKPESSGISVSSGLSQCYRGSGFSKALQEDDDLDFSLPDIRLEEGAMEDEELTNLNWLHESKNLLKSFGDSVLRSVSPVQDLDDDTPPSPAHSDMPYDARQNPNCKPPYSFSCLIFMAIEDSPTKRLPVKDIYNWILEHFPYFANAPTGWKNSVRHNLSLNKCFKKVDKERSQSIGKGSLWCIDPEYRQNLIQALKKTPYHPHSNVFNTPPASPQAYQSTSGPPLWPGSTFFKRNGALLQGGHSFCCPVHPQLPCATSCTQGIQTAFHLYFCCQVSLKMAKVEEEHIAKNSHEMHANYFEKVLWGDVCSADQLELAGPRVSSNFPISLS